MDWQREVRQLAGVATTIHLLPQAREGVRILALHGFAGSGLDFAALQAHSNWPATWICPDCPGHGGTALPGKDGSLNREFFLLWMEALFQHYQKEPVILLAYSQGGRLGLHWLATHHQQVAGAILISTTAGLETPMDRAERVQMDQARADRLLRQGIASFWEEWKREPLIATQDRTPEPWKTQLYDRRLENSAEGLASALHGWGQGSLPHCWEALPRIDCPILLIAGTADKKYCGLSERMTKLLPRARLQKIFQAGHAPHLENPRTTAAVIHTLLRPLFQPAGHPKENR